MKRKGFILLWTMVSMVILAMLAAVLTSLCHTAFSWEREREIGLDTLLIAQDAMEREKYNHRFSGGEVPLSGDIRRNGRVYHVQMKKEGTMIEGIPMVRISCIVTTGKERYETMTLMEERGGL